MTRAVVYGLLASLTVSLASAVLVATFAVTLAEDQSSIWQAPLRYPAVFALLWVITTGILTAVIARIIRWRGPLPIIAVLVGSMIGAAVLYAGLMGYPLWPFGQGASRGGQVVRAGVTVLVAVALLGLLRWAAGRARQVSSTGGAVSGRARRR